MFACYPSPGSRALTLAPSGRGEEVFDQLSGPVPDEIRQPGNGYVKAMFLRVAMLSGANQPVLRLRADTGAAVVLNGEPQPVFSRPAQTGLIGDAWLTGEPGDGVTVTVALNEDSPHLWRLGIQNTDTHANADYTWVVADNPGETSQPWTAPTFGSVTSQTIDVPVFPESFAPVDVCVDPSTHAVYTATMNAGLCRIANGTRTMLPTPPGIFAVAHDPVRDQLFVTQASGRSLFAVSGGAISNPISIATPGGPDPQFARLAIDPVHRRVYVANSVQNVVAVVHADTHEVVSLLPVGRQPLSVAVDAASGTAYVTNGKDNTISVITADAVAGTLPALPGTDTPGSVAVAPGGGALFVGSGSGPRIATVDPQGGTTALVPPIRDDENHSDFTGCFVIDAARFLGYVFLGSQARQVSPLFAFDTRIAAPAKSTGAMTPAYATAAVDTSTGRLYATYGATNVFATGMRVLETSTRPG